MLHNALKNSAIVAAFFVSSLASAGSLEIPYEPSIEAIGQTSGADSWFELYARDVSDTQKTLKKLTEEAEIPDPLGVGINDSLHVTIEGKQLELKKSSESYSRGNASISYEQGCANPPRVGDKWEASYTLKNVSVDVDFTIAELHTYGGDAVEQARLDTSIPLECEQVVESRIIYTGNVIVKGSGTTESHPAFAQLIFEGDPSSPSPFTTTR